MGQKVDPRGLRLGVNKDWQSKWYAEKGEYVTSLNNDIKIREFLTKELKDAAVSEIVIERKNNKISVDIYTAKPGVIIGRGGEDIDKLRKTIKKVCKEDKEVFVNIKEVKNTALNAELVAQNIAKQIENRGNFRTVQKKAIKDTMKAGAKGIKTLASGRLNGVEIARSEFYNEGTIPLHTLRADIDYGFAEADTTFGKIGIKVWIYKGEVLNKKTGKGGNVNATNAKKN